jgi:hypothetical protein
MTIALLCVCLLGTGAVQAQSPARYVPEDSWIAPLTNYLQRAGILRSLDPLTRPLRRGDIARAIAETDTTALDRRLRTMLRLIAQEVAEPGGEVRWTLDPHAGVLAASDASRWTFRPSADSAAAYPQVGVSAALDLPMLSLVAAPAIDNRLLGDPWYQGKKDRFVAGRSEQSYVIAGGLFAELFFGTTNRNWGPSAIEGLLVSTSPYSSEHVFVRVGPERLRIELIVEQLDALVPWDSSPAQGRWLISHRLVARPSGRLTFSLEESVLAATNTVPWRYLNPAALALVTQTDAGPPGNAMLGASAVWDAGRARVFGQVLVDDIQIDRTSAGDKEPTAWGMTLGGEGGVAGGRATWSAYYTRVANLTYRTPLREEQYTVNSVGLARNQSDYDQVSLRLEAPAPRGLLLGAEVHLVRQGQGDMRQAYPPVAAFADSLAFLTGVVERTVQVAGTVRWTPSRALSVAAFAGYHGSRNADHVAGLSAHRLVWRVQGTLRRRYTGALNRP